MKEKELEKIMKALANKRRILILRFLKNKGKASVGNIAEEIKLSFKSTSRHLQILTKTDILDKDQVNLSMLYYLSKNPHPIVRKLLEIV